MNWRQLLVRHPAKGGEVKTSSRRRRLGVWMTLSFFAVGMVFSEGDAQQALAAVVIMVIGMTAAGEALNAILAYYAFRDYEETRILIAALERNVGLLKNKRQRLLEEIEEYEAMDMSSGKDNVVH